MLHLHQHSVYSYKKSISQIDQIMEEFKLQGEKSFCITDDNSLTSFIKAFSLAKKNNIKFIPGYQATVKTSDNINKNLIEEEIFDCNKKLGLKRTTDEVRQQCTERLKELNLINPCENHSIIILAKNDIGLSNLITLFSDEKESNEIYKITNEEILKHNEGLIILSGGLDGEIMYYIKNKQFEKAEQLMLQYKDIFKENFFAQLEYNFTTQKENDKLFGALTEIEAYLKLLELANKNDIKIIVTNDCYYVKKEDRKDYRLFKNIYADKIEKFYSDSNHMTTEEELKEILLKVYPEKDVLEGFKNIKIIDSICENIELPNAPKLVSFESELLQACKEGWNKLRKGTKYEEESKKRYEYELTVINDKVFSEYFIKVYKIITAAKDLNILLGPGRGSGCGSEICYLLGITCVDPLKYNLYFERFLNPKRSSYPDIDIDMASIPGVIPGTDHSNLIPSRNLLVEKLINDNVFKFAGYIQNEVNASTLVLFKNVAKYYDIPSREANKITTDPIYSQKLKEKEYTGWLKEAVMNFQFTWQDFWDQIETKMDFCYKLNGTPCNSSIAASGVIMSSVNSILPVHDGSIGYNGVDLESNGYIKYDLLSLDTLNQIQHFKGMDVQWNKNDDQAVWDTISEGDTDFVFQFSSPGMKRILTGVKPNNIETLAEINALYRPGPISMGLIEKYIEMKNGRDPGLSDEEVVISRLLKESFGENHSGLVIFQEDVMKLCQIGSGFSLAEADDIRKGMGKKKPELLKAYKDQFIRDWKYEGDASIIWKALEDFGAYAFNKSHAVAYSIIAYQTALLWTYDRDEFLKYNLNYETKDRYTLAIDKCKSLGMKFRYPTLDTMDGGNFDIKNNEIYIPGNADKNYESVVEFLFGETNNLLPLIYKGICDHITKDRYALALLSTSLLKKPRENALYMEPKGVKFTKLAQILEGLLLCEGIVEYKREKDGIHVLVKRARGNPNEIIFHNDDSDYNRFYNFKYDSKYFGSVRKNIINDLPYINTSAIENVLTNIKERQYNKGEYEGKKAYKMMVSELNDYMKEYFSNEFKNTFSNIYALIEEVTPYDSSTRLLINFNDKQEILYIKGSLINKVNRMSKKALIKMTLKYSPYINKRKEIFIYDFDILDIEEILF